MGKDRLAAFSDGVIAIIITIMVLELQVPHGADLAALKAVAAGLPQLRPELRLSRHLLEQSPPPAARRRRVDGLILWANLTCCSGCRWCRRHRLDGREPFARRCRPRSMACVLLMPAIAYYLLQKAIMRTHGEHSVLARALGSDIKGKISPLLYAAAIPLAFVLPWLSIAIYVLVALLWLIPDRRIERALREI